MDRGWRSRRLSAAVSITSMGNWHSICRRAIRRGRRYGLVPSRPVFWTVCRYGSARQGVLKVSSRQRPSTTKRIGQGGGRRLGRGNRSCHDATTVQPGANHVDLRPWPRGAQSRVQLARGASEASWLVGSHGSAPIGVADGAVRRSLIVKQRTKLSRYWSAPLWVDKINPVI